MTNDTSLLDSLLDSTLDDLADLPEFKPFPDGAHRCSIEFKQGDDPKKPSMQVKFTALETLELTNNTDEPLVPGTTTSVFFYFQKKDGTPNEYAQGEFKIILAGIKSVTGGNSNREVIELSKGAEYAVLFKVKKGKDANGNATVGNTVTAITSP